jgi:hypothetical protein
LIFEENFDEIDFEKWEHELTLSGGGNWEFQWYTNERSNSWCDNGTLHIAPTLVADEFGEAFLSSGNANLWGGAPADQCTNPAWWGCERQGNPTNFINPIKSARLRTVNSFAFKYGIVEARVKNPTGDWLWPAVWLMPKHNAYSGWPRSGEIDLMESRGNQQLFDGNDVNVGTEQVGSTIHYGPYWNQNGFEFANFHRNTNTTGTGFNDNFHIYRLGWTDTGLQFSVDDVVIGTIDLAEIGDFWQFGQFEERFGENVRFNPWTRAGATNMAPFDQEFYMIINLAVGGTNGFFWDGLRNENGAKPWRNDSPTAFRDFWNGRNQWLSSWGLGVDDRSHLQVDYVRIYAV